MSDVVEETLAWLARHGTARNREGMARYAIRAKKSFGVPMAAMRGLAKSHRGDHELALALWQTGWHEARTLACFVDDPVLVTPAQMDAWCRGFENWAICDTACFALFCRTPHAWRKARQWTRRRGEFTKRAAFALLAGLAVHAKKEANGPFLEALALVEAAADDERNFVKKAVSWALRSIGKRDVALQAAALAVARRLVESPSRSARWIGKDAERELAGPAVARRLAGVRRPVPAGR